MTVTSQQHQAELHKKLWAMANSLRGQMEASEFKNYILGIIFYRFLSENTEAEVNDSILKNNADGETYESLWEDGEYGQDVRETLVDTLGYEISPQHLFSAMLDDVRKGAFEIETLQEAVNILNASTIGTETQESFEHLFDDLDLHSSKLGRTNAQRASLIGKIIQHVADIPFAHGDVEIDVLGDAYEYMISKFASTAGKSAGEFYTPQQVSRILAKIVSHGKQQLKSVYDPTCGSGSLLLRVSKELKNQVSEEGSGKVMKFYGQELTSATYNLARMNMMLHGVKPQDFDIKNDNTLTDPQHMDEKFEAIVANPPYSAHWDSSKVKVGVERFSDYAKSAPKTKADYAFVQHMIHHLDDNGTMAVVLPHGVLFRGAAEGSIRKHLIEKNYLDAVIGLPANIFYGTSIPTSVLVFKKCREDDEKVLFIDASQEFEKGKNSNSLRDSDVNKIVDAYVAREDMDKFARGVTLGEIKENDYNLNIPRYVDSFDDEELVNLNSVWESLERVDIDINNVEEKIHDLMKYIRVRPAYELAAQGIFDRMLETAPTLTEIALIRRSAAASDIFTYDGREIESHAFSDYTTELRPVLPLLSQLESSLGIGNANFVILVNKNREYLVFVDEEVGEAIVNHVAFDTNGRIGIADKPDAERWAILEQAQAGHTAYAQGKVL